MEQPITSLPNSSLYPKNLQAFGSPSNKLDSFLEPFFLDPKTIRLLPAKKEGMMTLQIQGEKGESFFLHSQYDPQQEAQRYIETLPHHPNACYLFIGFGLGYPFQALRKHLGPHNLVVLLEPKPELFKTALSLHDFTQPPVPCPMLLYLSPNLPDAYSFLRNHVETIFSKSRIILITLENLHQAFPSLYPELTRLMGEYTNIAQTLLSTEFILPQRTFVNACRNLPEYIQGIHLDAFREKTKGKPVLVVAAGPSLYHHLPLLKSIQHHIPILAVSTALKTLLAHGITPHFVCLVDFHTISQRYFEDLPKSLKTIMIADPKCAWEALHAFPGLKTFSTSPELDLLLKEHPLPYPTLSGGGTVAHLAFNAALFLEADPILLVGLDLAYLDYVTHVPYTGIYTQWASETGPFMTYELKEYETLFRLKDSLTHVPSVIGEDIPTDTLMFTYLRDFESAFSNTRQTIINCSPRGAKLSHTRSLPLETVLQEFHLLDYDFETIFQNQHDQFQKKYPSSFHESICTSLQSRIDEFKDLQKLYEKSLQRLKQAKEKLSYSYNVDPLIRQVLALKKKITRYEDLYFLIKSLSSSDEFIHRRWGEEITAPKETLDSEWQTKMAERDISYLESLNRCQKHIQKLLQTCLNEIKETSPKPTENPLF